MPGAPESSHRPARNSDALQPPEIGELEWGEEEIPYLPAQPRPRLPESNPSVLPLQSVGNRLPPAGSPSRRFRGPRSNSSRKTPNAPRQEESPMVSTGEAGATPVSTIPTGRTNPGDPAMRGGRNGIHRQRTVEGVDFSPNRLQTVLSETCEHAPLRWMDSWPRLQSIGPWLLLGVFGCALLGLGGTELIRLNQGQHILTQSVPAAPSLRSRQKLMRSSFEQYLKAAAIGEKLRWVADPERVEPLMEEFYGPRQERDPQVESFEVGEPVRSGNDWWFPLLCNVGQGVQRTVMIRETPEAGLLDWENFVMYGSMTWKGFHQARPVASQSLRARVRLSDQYSGKYSEKDYVACEITHPSHSPVLYGYARRNSAAGAAILQLPESRIWQQAHLYLRWESDAGSPQNVQVAEFLRNNWRDEAGNASGHTMPMSMKAMEAMSDERALFE